MPRIFTSDPSNQSEPFLKGLSQERAHQDAQKELANQGERLSIYRRNLAMAEESQAAEMQVFQQQQDQQRAAQEYAAIQNNVGDARIRAAIDGGMPTDQREAELYAKLSPGKDGDQELWRQDKIRRTQKLKEETQMSTDMEGFQVMAQVLPEETATTLAQELQAAPSYEAFQATMQKAGKEYEKAVKLEQKNYVSGKISEAIGDAYDKSTGAEKYLIGVQGDLVQGVITPGEAAAQIKWFSKDAVSGLEAVIRDQRLLRKVQDVLTQEEMARVRGEAEQQGGMPPASEAGEADAPVAPAEAQPVDPSMLKGLSITAQKLSINAGNRWSPGDGLRDIEQLKRQRNRRGKTVSGELDALLQYAESMKGTDDASFERALSAGVQALGLEDNEALLSAVEERKKKKAKAGEKSALETAGDLPAELLEKAVSGVKAAGSGIKKAAGVFSNMDPGIPSGPPWGGYGTTLPRDKKP